MDVVFSVLLSCNKKGIYLVKACNYDFYLRWLLYDSQTSFLQSVKHELSVLKWFFTRFNVSKLSFWTNERKVLKKRKITPRNDKLLNRKCMQQTTQINKQLENRYKKGCDKKWFFTLSQFICRVYNFKSTAPVQML